MKLNKLWPFFLLFLIIVFAYREVIFKNYVPVPADTLVGAYYPWLDYKWGYPVGVPVKNSLLSDSFSEFFILKKLVIEHFKQGELPLWNRFIFAGTPLFATYHVAPLNPANLLFLLSGFWGWRLFIFSSSLFAALTMYLYLGNHTDNKLARIISALVFAMTGPMTTWVEFGTAVWSAAFVPLLLFCLDQIILKQKKQYLWFLSILTSLMIFAGHVQLDTYLVPIVFGYSFFLYQQNQNNQLTILFYIFVALVAGWLLSAIQLLPTFQLLQTSIRGQEQYAADFNYGLINVSQLLRLWVPDFFGHPSTINHWGSFIYHEYVNFVGTLTLPLVLPLFHPKFRTKICYFFGPVFFLALFLSLNHPISRFIFSLPIPLLTYSSASRLFFVSGLAAAVLLSQALIQIHKPEYLKLVIFFSLVLIAITLTALAVLPGPNLLIAARNSLLPLVLLTIPLLFFIIRFPKSLILLLLLLIFSLDLTRYFRKYNPVVPPHLVFPTTPILDYLTNQPGIFRIATEKTNLLPPNTWAYYHLESISGYEPLRPLRYGQLFHRLDNQPLENKVSRYSELEGINPNFLDALNVSYFLALAPQQDATPSPQLKTALNHGYQLVFHDGHVQIYKNPNALPRAYSLRQFLIANSDQELAQLINDPNFDPRSTAIIEQPLPDPITATGSADINITDYQDQKIKINTQSSAPSILVIANNFDLGWQAKIDQQPTKLFPVNGALTGLYLPLGDHQIELNYLPKELSWGGKISILTLLLWIITFKLKS